MVSKSSMREKVDDYGKDRISDKGLKSASFISLKATASTGVMINQFPKYFQVIEMQKLFYQDMFLLHLDIYHRLGAGLIAPNDDKNIPTSEEMDKHIGTVSGLAVAYIEKHSEEIPFIEEIDIDEWGEAWWKFHEWSAKFTKIYEGENTLLHNFILKWAGKLSITKSDLDKFSFYLNDSILQYFNDYRFKDIFGIEGNKKGEMGKIKKR